MATEAERNRGWSVQDQLLNIVVQAERPELAEEKVRRKLFFLGKPGEAEKPKRGLETF